MSEPKEYLAIDRPETTNRDKDVSVRGGEEGVWIFEGNGEVFLTRDEADLVRGALAQYFDETNA